MTRVAATTLLAVFLFNAVLAPLAVPSVAHAEPNTPGTYSAPTRTAGEQEIVDNAKSSAANASFAGQSLAICGAAGLGGLASAYISGLLSEAITGVATALGGFVPITAPKVQLLQQGQITIATFLKSIAYCAAKTLARKVTADIVQWATRGFQGKPTFVTNTKKFLTDIADEEIGNFIYGSPLAFVCSPFKVSLQVALSRTFLSQKRPVCTLTQVTRNINAFTNDFRQGGWPAWLEFTTVPANNPFGTYLSASIQLQANIAGRQQRDLAKVLSNAGFRDITKCVRPGPGGSCAQYGIVTPGSVVSAQLNEVLPEGLKELRLADDFGEIVNALIVGLLTKALTGVGGLSGVSSRGYYTPSGNFVSESYVQTLQKESVQEVGALKVSLAQQTDVVTADEEAYLALKQDSKRKISSAQAAVSAVNSCYTQKVQNTNLSAADRDEARKRSSAAAETANSLQLRFIKLDEQIAAATDSLRTLADFKNRALIATRVNEVESLTYEFQSYKSPENILSLREGLAPKIEYDQLVQEMDAIIAQASKDLAECQAFPPQSQ